MALHRVGSSIDQKHKHTVVRIIIRKTAHRIVGAGVVLRFGTTPVRPVLVMVVVLLAVVLLAVMVVMMVVVVMVVIRRPVHVVPGAGPVRGGHRGPPGRGEQRHVQGHGQRVPRVVHRGDGRHRVHGPVEAQPPRVHEQPHVLGRQVEERQRARHQAGRLGGRVVGGREHGRPGLAHQRHTYEQQTGRGARQDRQRPVHAAGVLQRNKTKKKNIINTRTPSVSGCYRRVSGT